MISDNSDLYGSVLWDMSHLSIDKVCTAWRKGLRRALGLPWRTYSALLAVVTGTLPLMDELLCRTAMFVSRCLTSDNSLVNFVSHHSVYVLRQNSPVGRNALWCCTRFGLRLNIKARINRKFVSRCVSTELHTYNVTASVIYDLLCVKSHQAELSILDAADIDVMIESLCVS